MSQTVRIDMQGFYKMLGGMAQMVPATADMSTNQTYPQMSIMQALFADGSRLYFLSVPANGTGQVIPFLYAFCVIAVMAESGQETGRA